MNPNIKPDEHSIAESVLLDAAQAIRDRGKEHGHTERSFGMIGELWSTYITHAFTLRGETKLYPHDVANLMGLVKLARAVYGHSRDNFVDGAAFTALSAMLTPEPKDEIMEKSRKTMAGLFPKKKHPQPQFSDTAPSDETRKE